MKAPGDRAASAPADRYTGAVTASEFHEIEHTADWALRVRGRDHAALFATAARGMFSLLHDLDVVDVTQQLEIELMAHDTETLLIDWLNELLYEAEERTVVFTEFAIHVLDGVDAAPHRSSDDEAREADAPKARLRATVRGGPARLDKCIKAATFSSLRIAHDAHGYQADIVFDV